ncbi:MAG: DUF1156 domain-containing protein [Rhodobacteraceae bacterium]|nr:DUF1156 domain-containing protein [Paracoccaceae bacterium]
MAKQHNPTLQGETDRSRHPLEVITAAAAWEKSMRHRHPSTLHLWCCSAPWLGGRG